MAAIQSNPTVQESPQKTDLTQISQRYQNRAYQPYVFQPNFLKQQIRQRELEKAAQLGENPSTIQLSLLQNRNNGPNIPIPQSILEDMMNRKKSGRKVIDWTPSCALYLERRRWQREFEDVPSLLPDTTYTVEMQSTLAYRDSSASSVATKFVRSATNKMKCPVYKVVWTPDGRRLVTGSASGEFTLWNGTAFNFETILQAHDSPVRAMAWSRNDAWLITGDNQGYIKYWQLNMNNVKMYQAHKDQACRSVCFGPTDSKFVTASDDGTVRVWDFLRCHEEHILRGHGADVKQVDWHPQKCLVASASKDLQTPVKLWDPRAGHGLATIHAHKGTVMDIKFNRNGNWFLTASRDHLIKLYDIRNLKEERQIFRGHKKEAFSVAWHPIHEDMFASGGSEGNIMYWQVGEDKELGTLENAHDSLIWSLAWHPLGHVLVSGSNDHSTKFWTRNRPGDAMRDRYNLGVATDDNTASKTATSNNIDKTEVTNIPGMGDTDAAVAEIAKREEEKSKSGIPGLDWSYEEKNEFERKIMTQMDYRKKIPYARPVPRSFAAAWESNKEGAPRRYSRSPSPGRYDDPSGWHRDDAPPSSMPRSHRSYPASSAVDHSEDFILVDDHLIPVDPDSKLVPPPQPPIDEPLPPPFKGPPGSGLPPPEFDHNLYPEGQVINDSNNTRDEYYKEKSFNNMGEFPEDNRDFPPKGPPPRDYMPERGPGKPHERRGPPLEIQEWSMPKKEVVIDEEFLRNAEELYGAEYAELLAMDNLDETLLANYELEREALGLKDKDMDFHNSSGPPPPPPRHFRGRGGPPRGRGRPQPMFEGRGRGAPRRMRRGGRRPPVFD